MTIDLTAAELREFARLWENCQDRDRMEILSFRLGGVSTSRVTMFALALADAMEEVDRLNASLESAREALATLVGENDKLDADLEAAREIIRAVTFLTPSAIDANQTPRWSDEFDYPVHEKFAPHVRAAWEGK